MVAVVLAPMPRRQRFVAAAVLVVPAGTALLLLAYAWGGLTPPSAQEANGSGAEPLGLPVGFALWAFFATPLLLLLRSRIPTGRTTMIGASVSALACAAPAVIWTSTYSFPDRMGGWPWQIFKVVGGVLDRSPALILLAMIGGAAVFLVLRALDVHGGRYQARILGTAIYSSILVSTAASFALPKYREIPLLICFPLLVVAVWSLISADTGKPRSTIVLAAPAALQVLAASMIVGLPYVQYLLDPSSVPPPEWVQRM